MDGQMDKTGWLEGSAWEKPGRRWGGGAQPTSEGGGFLDIPGSQSPPIGVQMGPQGTSSCGLSCDSLLILHGTPWGESTRPAVGLLTLARGPGCGSGLVRQGPGVTGLRALV